MDDETTPAGFDPIQLVTGIVSAYVSNNSVRPADLPDLIATTYAAIAGLSGNGAAAESAIEKPTPAQIRKSITYEALISFIDGKPYKTLKRHLMGNGLTVEQYRERYGLPKDYPSTSAGYSAQRSELAKSFGLGQVRRYTAAAKDAPADETAAEPETPKKRGRPKTKVADTE